MSRMSLVARWTGLGVTALFVVLGLLFAGGYLFEDPGGWTAVGVTAATVLPLAGLTLLAIRRPREARWVLTVLVGLLAAYEVVQLWVSVRFGPPVASLVLALPIAVMGLKYAARAGELLLALAALPVLSWLFGPGGAGRGGPPFGAFLGGSSGVVVVPLAFFGVLFVAAALFERAGSSTDAPMTTAGRR